MVPSFLHLEDSQEILDLDALLIDGTECQNNNDILKEIHTFYHSLYTKSTTESESSIDTFLQTIPSLPKCISNTTVLTGPITMKEVEDAIGKLCPNKTPGCDGLTAEFYQHFQQEISMILCDVLNQIFWDKSLSDMQKIAVIILLFKKGNRLLLGNYRPISLTNADYKIIAYVLSSRLEEHLPFLISSQQTAYMKTCFVGTNITFIQYAMDYFKDTSKMILFLDYKKAFDSISHEFIFHLLSHIGLPDHFVQWVRIMYGDVISTIHHKNWFTPMIPID